MDKPLESRVTQILNGKIISHRYADGWVATRIMCNQPELFDQARTDFGLASREIAESEVMVIQTVYEHMLKQGRTKRLHDSAQALLEASEALLYCLDELTTEQFLRGDEREPRDVLRSVVAKIREG